MKTIDELWLDELSKSEPEKKKTNKKQKPSSVENENIIYTSYLEDKEYILEQIDTTELTECTELLRDDHNAKFVKYSRLDDKWEIVNDYLYNGKLVKPITDKIYQLGGVKLPSGIQEYGTTKELVDQIKGFLNKNIEIPSFYEGLLPNLLLFYWVYEKFPFIPYLGFVGGTGTGKTTAMLDFGNLCYKPINTTGSLTIASIFRVATKWKGTLLIDEFYKVGENSNEIITFLKAGVSDQLVLRTEGDKTKEVNVYIVKSPKIFTSEKAIDDAGLNSRTMFIQMQKAKRRLPLFRLQRYYKEVNEIRNKLLLWRLRNLHKINLQKIEYGFDEFKEFDGRVQQILTGIYYLADDATKKSIIEFAHKQQAETKRERRESVMGMVFEILYEMWDRDESAPLKTVTSMLNEQLKSGGNKIEYTERKIGNVVRKELGFDTERGGQGGNTFVIRNDEIEANLKDYFGITTSRKSSVHSVSSVNETLEEAKEIFNVDNLT